MSARARRSGWWRPREALVERIPDTYDIAVLLWRQAHALVAGLVWSHSHAVKGAVDARREA